MNWLYSLIIDGYDDRWWICYPDCTKMQGPYKTASIARGQLTRTINFYERKK